MLTEGYAPFEQYSRKGHQGPWTDVYGAAAVLYRCVTGEAPPAANDRMLGDDLRPAATFGVPASISAALAAGLALRPEDRPQTVDAFRALLGRPPQPVPQPPVVVGQAPVPSAPPKPAIRPDHRPRRAPTLTTAKRRRLLPVLVLLLAAGAGGYAWWQQQTPPPPRAGAPGTTVPPQPTVAVVPRRPVVPPPARQPFEPEMVAIPAGSFLMGSPDSEPERQSDEGPRHRVQVPAFEMGKYEVTFAEWDACVADGGCDHNPEDAGWGRGTRPVFDVTWDDAQQYVQWLSQATGKSYRLPSEAEWEYAARAGTTTPFSTGNCINTSQANYRGKHDYNGCGAKTGVFLGKTQPVGSYPANPWGLHDLHGNVWEWTEDCWNDGYAGAPTDGGAWRHGDCARRVPRGGSWFINPRNLRSGIRNRYFTGVRYYDLGFRVARTLTP